MTDQEKPGEFEFAEAWPGLRDRWISQAQSVEQFVRAAFLAGFEARSAQLAKLAYTPDSERKMEIKRRFAPPRPTFYPSGGIIDTPYTEAEVKAATFGALQQDYVHGPEWPEGDTASKGLDYQPDYTQHGTVTGRIGRSDPEKARRMAEAFGAKPVAGPSPATLERIQRDLAEKGVAAYPEPRPYPLTREDTALMPVAEDPKALWDARVDASGPLPTVLSAQEEGNG